MINIFIVILLIIILIQFGSPYFLPKGSFSRRYLGVNNFDVVRVSPCCFGISFNNVCFGMLESGGE